MSGTIQTGTHKINGVSTDYNFPDPLGTVQTLTSMDVNGVQTDYNRGPALGTLEAKTHKINGVSKTYWVPNVTGFGSSTSAIPLPIQLGATFAYNFVGANASNDIIEGATNVNVAGWQDITSNNNDAEQLTPANQPTFTQTDGPITFDGGDSVDTNSIIDLSTGTAFTVLFRYFQTSSVNKKVLGCKQAFNSTEGWYISTKQLQTLEIFGSGSSGSTNINLGLDVRGKLVTLAIIFKNNNSIDIYYDGVFNQNFTGITFPVTPILPIAIGKGSGAQDPFVGDIEHVSAYPTALTAQNIADMQTYIDGL